MVNIADVLHPLNSDEVELAKLEQSWADHAAFLRTGTNWRRAIVDRKQHNPPRGLLEMHNVFELHRERYERGDSSALLDALYEACKNNLPLPYWCSDAWVKTIDDVRSKPVSMHFLLGLDDALPEGDRGKKKRERYAMRHAVYWAVAAEVKSGKKKLNAALKEALRDGRLPCSIRQAATLYSEQDAIQERYLDTSPDRPRKTLHRIR